MTAVFNFPTHDRVAALVQCMQARVCTVSASRYQFSLGFDGLAVGPPAWDTVSLVQAEMEKALKHVGLAFHALTDWLRRGPSPRSSRSLSTPDVPGTSEGWTSFGR
jgi:hypothetical protein